MPEIMISLNKVRENAPCRRGWETLLASKGKTKADDVLFPLSDVLASNNLNDALWCIKCLPEHKDLWLKFARWCASLNVERIEPYCTGDDYQLIVNFLETGNDVEAAAAEAALAAVDAAEAAAVTDARAAAWAADAATWAAMSDRAADAAVATWAAVAAAWAVRAAVATEHQIRTRFLEILNTGEW